MELNRTCQNIDFERIVETDAVEDGCFHFHALKDKNGFFNKFYFNGNRSEKVNSFFISPDDVKRIGNQIIITKPISVFIGNEVSKETKKVIFKEWFAADYCYRITYSSEEQRKSKFEGFILILLPNGRIIDTRRIKTTDNQVVDVSIEKDRRPIITITIYENGRRGMLNLKKSIRIE